MCAGLDEPKIATRGRPSAAATCISPESFPTNPEQRAKHAAISGRVRVPIAVTASEFQLSPRTLSVSEPGVITIALSNRDPVDHNLSIEGVNGLLSVPASGRGVASFRLEAPGTYQITCAVPNHVEAGMSAMIIVGEPPPTGSAGD